MSCTGRDRLRACGGQTPTEYLMVAGIMTAIAILILIYMYAPWRDTMRDVTDCVREDDCAALDAK